MKDNKQFTSEVSGEEHRKGIKETYAKEVQPFLAENKEAYELYLQDKSSLKLTPAQKASIRCQYPV